MGCLLQWHSYCLIHLYQVICTKHIEILSSKLRYQEVDPLDIFLYVLPNFCQKRNNTEVVVLAVRICSHKKILMYFSKKYIYQIFVFLKVSANFFLKVSAKCLINDTEPITLRKKCPNTELFLVLTFLHSDWIRRFTP